MNVLIGIDIMILEKIDILISQIKVYIDSCDITVPIKVYIKSHAIIYLVHVKKFIIISLYT